MRVNVACAGRFLSLQLSGQLKRLGCLGRHYTCTPMLPGAVRPGRYGLDRSDVRTLVGADIFKRVVGRLGRRARVFADQVKTLWFQRWVARKFEPCDVIHAWAGSALSVFEREVCGEAVRVLDRSSAHRRIARRILDEEYQRCGARYVDRQGGMDLELAEYESADHIVVPSTFVLNSFLEQGHPREKLSRVSFGSLAVRDGRPRRPDGAFCVVYVGTLRVHKGVRYFLKAASLLRGLPDFEVLLVGPPPDKHTAPYLAKYREFVRYLGYVPQRKLYEEIYPKASVLVQPSVLEGLSFVLLEALAHGVPVIATDHSGAPDVITDGEEGFLVPVRDPAAIAEKVLFLYKHRGLLEQMSGKALSKARTQLTWDTYGEQVVGIYRKLLADRQ